MFVRHDRQQVHKRTRVTGCVALQLDDAGAAHRSSHISGPRKARRLHQDVGSRNDVPTENPATLKVACRIARETLQASHARGPEYRSTLMFCPQANHLTSVISRAKMSLEYFTFPCAEPPPSSVREAHTEAGTGVEPPTSCSAPRLASVGTWCSSRSFRLVRSGPAR